MRHVPRYDAEEDERGRLLVRPRPPEPTEHHPVPPQGGEPVNGRRVILGNPLGWWRDFRAVGEPFHDGARWVLRIAHERDWYAHDGAPPESITRTWTLAHLWTDD